MRVPTSDNASDDNYYSGCKVCGMHFAIEDEKDIHESRCVAAATPRNNSTLSSNKETWYN